MSIVAYVLGIAGAFLHPWIGCLFYVAVAAMWLVPDRRIESRLNASRVKPRRRGDEDVRWGAEPDAFVFPRRFGIYHAGRYATFSISGSEGRAAARCGRRWSARRDAAGRKARRE